MEYTPHPSGSLSDEFLSRLVAEINDDTVIAIILHGSYVRGQALPPYSDVDLVRITREGLEQPQAKRFIWRDNRLISISSRPISLYREWLSKPERAIFIVSGIQEARILLDKDGSFHRLQQEVRAFQWEPLQAAANTYASQVLVVQTEIILKILRALQLHDAVALADMLLDLLSAVTEAVAIYYGVLVTTGNTYFHQVQKSVGQDSTWTRYHLRVAGIVPSNAPVPSIEERGRAALSLYQKTAQLLRPALLPEHEETIDETIRMMKLVLLSGYLG